MNDDDVDFKQLLSLSSHNDVRLCFFFANKEEVTDKEVYTVLSMFVKKRGSCLKARNIFQSSKPFQIPLIRF